MEVRPATAGDVPAIRELAVDAWHAAHDHILGEQAVAEVVDDWYDPADLRDQVARERGHFLVADDAGVVGFAHAGPSDDSYGDAVLPRIYVDPARWGDGTGTAMLGAVTDRLRADGHECLWLAVLAGNEVGRSFYESRGFERVERREVELAGVETEDVVMATDL
ncbi:MAG: GNAT family N-acetyltransferase [Halobacteriales archaeon]